MRYYIIAGEYSGDMHGGTLITHLKSVDAEAHFWCCGGRHMSKALGENCAVNCSMISYIGFDFVKGLFRLFKLLQICKQALMAYKPDVVILIDYGGFNLKIAQFAKNKNYKVYYYIPPKIWAHGEKRILNIRKSIDHICSIFPFEVHFYQALGYQSITYVGNPTVNQVFSHHINRDFILDHGLSTKPIIALLPGSRVDEVKRILPMMLSAQLDGYQFVVSGLSHISRKIYENILPSHIKIVYNQSYDLLAFSKAALVAAGTASLEAALWDIPQLVVYKMHPLTFFFYKRMVRLPYVSLVNILLRDGLVVPELIQENFTAENLQEQLSHILSNSCIEKQKKAYDKLKKKLGNHDAAQQAAKMIISSYK